MVRNFASNTPNQTHGLLWRMPTITCSSLIIGKGCNEEYRRCVRVTYLPSCSAYKNQRGVYPICFCFAEFMEALNENRVPP